MRRSLAAALPLLAAACSLTALDGYSGDVRPAPDDRTDATVTPVADGQATEAGKTTDGDAGPSADPYGDAVRADQPAAWWRCEDEKSSAMLADEIGAHHGRVYPKDGKPITIEYGLPGAVGKSVRFGVNAGFFEVADVFDFAGQSEFALEAWARNDAPVEKFELIFHKRQDDAVGNPADGWLLFLTRDTSSLSFQFWKAASVFGQATFPAWSPGFHHVVVTGTKKPDGMTYVLYVDGAPRETTVKVTTPQPDSTEPISLGYNWTGDLDELAIYDHTLAADRVAAHHAAVKP